MRIIVAALFGLVAVAGPAAAKVGATQGAGSILCRALVANWKRDSANVFTFGQGSMDAYNKLRYVEGKPVIDLNPDDFNVVLQIAYLRTYCTNNPEQEVAAAFYELYKDMATHHGVSFP